MVSRRIVLLTSLAVLLLPAQAGLVGAQAIGPIESFNYGSEWGSGDLDYFQWKASSYSDDLDFFSPFFIPIADGGVLELTPTNMSNQSIKADEALEPFRDLHYNEDLVTDGLLETSPILLLLILPESITLKNGTIISQEDVMGYMSQDFIPNTLLILGETVESSVEVGDNFVMFKASSDNHYLYITYYNNGVLNEILYQESDSEKTFYLSYQDTGRIYEDSEFSPFPDGISTDSTTDDANETDNFGDSSLPLNFLLYPLAIGAIFAFKRKREL